MKKLKTAFSKTEPLIISLEPQKGGAQKQFKEECDINNILKKYNRTGALPELINKNPRYGDFSDPVSYHEACGIIAFANEQFAALPSHLRARFENDPEKFLEFTSKTENLEEMVKLGLATKRAPPTEDPQLTALKEIAANTKAPKTPLKGDSGVSS